MKTINETFTNEEYVQIMRIKNLLKMSWHDFILQIVEMAEGFVVKKMSNEGATEQEIENILSGSE